MSKNRTISWQSGAILWLILPVLAVHLGLELKHGWARNPLNMGMAVLIAVVFGAVVFRLRAATAGGAATGALVAATLYVWTPGWHTGLWPLAALLVLTLIATRFGRRAKEELGLGESHHGRTASQVAANIGFSAICGVLFSLAMTVTGELAAGAWLIGMVAALAEATADTLSSELGQVLGGDPRLLTTLKRVPKGTDGAVTAMGTLCGIAGAAVVTAVGAVSLGFSTCEAGIALGGAAFGMFVDSLLGEWVERRGWLGNDAVNVLSTMVAALAAVAAARWIV